MAVTVMEGPNVGQQRRLVSVGGADNATMIISAPFEPPLTPADYLSVNGYKGGFIVEGNRYNHGTVFQIFGGLADTVFSGNTLTSFYATAEAVPALPPMGSDMGGMVGGGGMQYAVSYQQELYNTWEHNVLSCGEDFLVSVFNFDHPSDNVPVQRKNATFNFAQVFRHNIFEAYATASWRWTRDHVIEHNALLPGYCAFISANVSATPINVSATNVGVVFRA